MNTQWTIYQSKTENDLAKKRRTQVSARRWRLKQADLEAERLKRLADLDVFSDDDEDEEQEDEQVEDDESLEKLYEEQKKAQDDKAAADKKEELNKKRRAKAKDTRALKA